MHSLFEKSKFALLALSMFVLVTAFYFLGVTLGFLMVPFILGSILVFILSGDSKE